MLSCSVTIVLRDGDNTLRLPYDRSTGPWFTWGPTYSERLVCHGKISLRDIAHSSGIDQDY